MDPKTLSYHSDSQVEGKPALRAGPEHTPRMEVLKGIAVSQGIVIGRIFVLDADARHIGRHHIQRDAVDTELSRLDLALRKSREELASVFKDAETVMGEDAAKVFLFHQGMLGDKSLIGPIRAMISSECVSAEHAVSHVLGEWSERFARMPDTAFRSKVNDLEDLQERILTHLTGERRCQLAQVPPGTVVIARDLTPTQAISFDRSRVLAFATDLGGKTSHTAIVARALGIPAVVGCQTLTRLAMDASSIIIDGDRGVVILEPNEETLDDYKAAIKKRQRARVTVGEDARLPAYTLDKAPVQVLGNIEFPQEIPSLLDEGGEGVGLYRTEFLYLASATEPTEEDHFAAYERCVKLLNGKPLVIRTVDLGADKYTQERTEVPERNPFLGLRSIRYCLRSIPMFKTQLRAILRASALGPIKVMFPLITTTNELRHAKLIVHDVMEDLEEEGIPFDRNLKLGMMVEVPAAALMADTFAREVDFFSIGTNDLIQYTLAVDRTNERVAGMYNPLNPAVLRLIRDTIRAARRHEIDVSLCGEAGGDPEIALLLIGMGLRTLSVSAPAIAPLKRLIRGVSMTQCERLARKAFSFDSDVQVAAYLRDRARKIVPEAFDGRSVDDADPGSGRDPV
ncbi:MAG: phosphoenolpyruvate--protein phosphotransferase [Phycisphaeraceae bacterium]|nr:MAG: phosphoenolpyruvate--protein phosphotransferase [Phycisphaeraceae bacterium]